jgi:GT2 family glycosyltransferase
MSDTPAQVWVVIVNWERPDDTIECIRSVLQSQTDGLKVLVVDNGSSDNSVARISGAYPQIDMLSLPDNLGFSNGYNAGIEYVLNTQASHCFLLNNDTTIDKNTIPALLASSWDVAVPKILLYHEPERIWAAGARLRSFPPGIIMIGYQKKDLGNYDSPRPLQYATGCALLVNRNVLKATQGFDPEFKNYMEDYDFCYRVQSAGFSIGYVPEARVLHKVSQTLGAFSPPRWRYQGKNTVLFYRKCQRFPHWYLWAVLSWFTLREILKRNTGILPHFWGGVKDGYRQLRSPEWTCQNKKKS